MFPRSSYWTCGAGEPAGPFRRRVPLDGGWEFVRAKASRAWCAHPGTEDSEPVWLPHSWNERDTFEPDIDYYQGWGSYRRNLPDAAVDSRDDGGRWFLAAGGFYGTGEFLVNGQRRARVDGQYLGCAHDVTADIAKPGAAVAWRLENRPHWWVLPGIRFPDFLLHGGLAGGAWLMRLPGAHLDGGRAQIVTRQERNRHWLVTIRFAVVNHTAQRFRGEVRWTLSDAAGHAVGDLPAVAVDVAPKSCQPGFETRTHVDDPALWSCRTPALHTAEGELSEGGAPRDSVRLKFGFRAAEFRADGFFLNGERQELAGCNRHENMPGFGGALPAALHREDARQIRSMGLNFVRLSHYPQHPEFLDACDESGLLVYAELASWKSVRAGPWLRAAVRQFTTLIERDRNRPSVVLWGMGNESRSRHAFTVLRETARRLDPTRPVTYAENHLRRACRQRVCGLPDVWGCNYELDALAAGRDASRLKCVVVSECSNEPHTARGHFDLEFAQVQTLRTDLARFRELPFVAGFALWCHADYATLRKRRYRRFCGIVDAFRMPKMAAWWLGAAFGTEPILRVWADWSFATVARERVVYVITSCPTVSIPGAALPPVAVEGHAVALPIAFDGQPLVVTASRDGTALRQTIAPWHAAARICLDPQKSDSSDTRAVGVSVVDRDGSRVADWSGAVALAGGGAGRIHFPRLDNTIAVMAGAGRFFVSAGGRQGEMRLSANAPGLAPGIAQIEFGPPRQ
jgi:beta-galactosidase